MKQVVNEGHSIGAHTFTHLDEDKVNYYKQQEKMYYELDLTQRVIAQNTGITTRAFRLPFWGLEDNITLNSLVLTTHAIQRGYTVIGSTVDTSDWEAKSPDQIINKLKLQPQNVAVVLMHDGGGDRRNTVEALPQVIEFYRSQGYRFATINDLVPNENLMTRSDRKQEVLSAAAFTTYDVYQKTPNAVTNLFLIGLGIYFLHTGVVVALAVAHRFREKKIHSKKLRFKPLVSVVVPVYDEEKVVEQTLKSITLSNYPSVEIIVVNDGSKDSSSKVVRDFIKNNNRSEITLIEQKNMGKFAALNTGFKHANGEIIVCIDADTIITRRTISAFVKHFRNDKTGAVSGNVKVGNQVNFLTKLQEVDYRTALNLERRAFSLLNSVFVVPGAIGAWRRSAVLEAGGFTGATLTEDGELGMRLLKLGYLIDFESRAIGLTEAPEKLSPLIKQRFRWTFGSLQTLWLHKDMLFRPKYGFFGMLVLPYTVFVQIPNLFLSPIFEFLAIPLAIFVSYQLVLTMIVILALSRLLLFVVAAKLGGESTKLAAFVLPHRFFYQFIWYFVFDVAVWTALKGSFIAWTKLERTGKVKVRDLVGPAIEYTEVKKV